MNDKSLASEAEDSEEAEGSPSGRRKGSEDSCPVEDEDEEAFIASL